MRDTTPPSTLLDVLAAAPGSSIAIIVPVSGTRVTYDALRDQVSASASFIRDKRSWALKGFLRKARFLI